ncbi:MAG: hypothetical protein R2845_05195 [Thermomicrobiales bacterium]
MLSQAERTELIAKYAAGYDAIVTARSSASTTPGGTPARRRANGARAKSCT